MIPEKFHEIFFIDVFIEKIRINQVTVLQLHTKYLHSGDVHYLFVCTNANIRQIMTIIYSIHYFWTSIHQFEDLQNPPTVRPS